MTMLAVACHGGGGGSKGAALTRGEGCLRPPAAALHRLTLEGEGLIDA